MTEAQARLAGVILSAIIGAGMLAGMWGAYQIMKQTRDDVRAFQRSLLDQMDHAKWAAEVDNARDAPGEGA